MSDIYLNLDKKANKFHLKKFELINMVIEINQYNDF